MVVSVLFHAKENSKTNNKKPSKREYFLLFPGIFDLFFIPGTQ